MVHQIYEDSEVEIAHHLNGHPPPEKRELWLFNEEGIQEVEILILYHHRIIFIEEAPQKNSTAHQGEMLKLGLKKFVHAWTRKDLVRMRFFFFFLTLITGKLLSHNKYFGLR